MLNFSQWFAELVSLIVGVGLSLVGFETHGWVPDVEPCAHPWGQQTWRLLFIEGPAQMMSPFYHKIFYYKTISMQFYNIPHSSTVCDIVGEMFKLKL